MIYLFLALAIVGETVGTTALKVSQGFTRPGYALLSIAAYAWSAYFLALTTQTMPIGVEYAIWCAVGIVLVASVGWVWYGQALDAAAFVGLGLIIAGVAVLNLLSASAHP